MAVKIMPGASENIVFHMSILAKDIDTCKICFYSADKEPVLTYTEEDTDNIYYTDDETKDLFCFIPRADSLKFEGKKGFMQIEWHDNEAGLKDGVSDVVRLRIKEYMRREEALNELS